RFVISKAEAVLSTGKVLPNPKLLAYANTRSLVPRVLPLGEGQPVQYEASQLFALIISHIVNNFVPFALKKVDELKMPDMTIDPGSIKLVLSFPNVFDPLLQKSIVES